MDSTARKVLLVEDNVDHAELAEIALRQNLPDLKVERVLSGKECLDKLKENTYGAIILDYLLPEMNGLEVQEEINRKGYKIPLIVVTGKGDERVAVEAMKKGAYDYIIKTPNYLGTLPLVVAKALEKYQLKQRLQESEQKYQEFIENASDGIYIHNLRGFFTLVNRKSEEITGYSKQELIGHHYRKLLSPQGRKAILEKIKNSPAQQSYSNCEVEIITKSGEKVPVELNITPVTQNGKLIGFQGIARDITERKRLEAERAMQNQRIRQMNEELTLKNRQLEQINQFKSEFVSNISHELRTPLNGILGYAELLRDGLYGQVNEEQKEALKNIIACGNHLLDLINEILDFSKIQSKQMKLNREICSLYDIVDAVVATVKPLAQEKNLELVVNCQKDLPPLYVDPKKIYQVLLNIVSNAVKFTEKGKVEIEVGRKESTVEFRVADTGIGISQDKIERIFGEFQQADGSSTRQHGGAGLGLSLSKKLIEMHQGQMWADSQLGQGSTFYFTLPVDDSMSSEDRALASLRKDLLTSSGFF